MVEKPDDSFCHTFAAISQETSLRLGFFSEQCKKAGETGIRGLVLGFGFRGWFRVWFWGLVWGREVDKFVASLAPGC